MVALLAADERHGVALAVGGLIAGFGCKVGGVDVVGLLLRHALLGQQLLESCILALGVVHGGAQLVDGGVCHADVARRGGHTRRGGAAAGLGIGQPSLGLRHCQAELGILDDDERVALMHGLELVEAYLADEARHTSVDGCDVLAHMGIVGPLHVSEVCEVHDYYGGSHYEQHQHDDVVEPAVNYFLFHSYNVLLIYFN